MKKAKYQIEDGVPVPELIRGRRAGETDENSKAGLIRQLKPGQSILFSDKKSATVCRYAVYAKKTTGKRYTVRKEGTGARVWCIEGGAA